MRLHHIALALLVAGGMATAVPAFAVSSVDQNSTLASPVYNGNQGGQALTGSGNGSNGQVGDNPNITDPGYNCHRHDELGVTTTVCPTDRHSHRTY